MNVRRARSLVIAALVLVTAAGCGDDASPAAEPEESAPPISAFATALDARCDKFADQVVAVTGGGEPAVAKFNADQPALKKLTDAFDADVAKIPVTSADDRTAAAAFTAFQHFSDAGYAKVLTVAKAGDQAKFDAAFDAFLRSFDDAPEPAALDTVGITCPAR